MIEATLLIVDDEEDILHLLDQSLKEVVSNIVVVSHATEAYEYISSSTSKIHCVVSDIMMPEMTGVQLLRKVREIDQNLPFIFYTAFADKELMLEALKLGAFDFLEKPDIRGLLSSIKSGLETGFDLHNGDYKHETTALNVYRDLLQKKYDK